MSAGLTAKQLDGDGWQALGVQLVPRRGSPVTLDGPLPDPSALTLCGG